MSPVDWVSDGGDGVGAAVEELHDEFLAIV